MKVGIIYATHFGFCDNAVKKLKKKLKTQSEIVSFDYKTSYDLSQYDALILGGSIRMGLLDQDFRGWLRSHTEEILQKPFALFVACGFSENLDEYVRNCFPKELVDNALATECIGGNLEGNYKFYDKWLVKIMTNKLSKEGQALPCPMYENLDPLAQVIDDAVQNIPQDFEEQGD